MIPTVVPCQTLRNMQHQKGSHIFKGKKGRYGGCHLKFKIKILEACNRRIIQFFFDDHVHFPLAEEQIDKNGHAFPYFQNNQF
jgi:hypothetical protein